MRPQQYVEHLRADGAAMVAAAEGNLAAGVPSCPGWTVEDLVVHTGGVHRFWGQVVERKLQSYEDADPERSPGESDPVEWLRDGIELLASVLAAADPTQAVWTWAHRKDAGFVQRRMAQETAVHRWDAEAAFARAEPIDTTLAADGINEYFYLFIPASEDDPLQGDGELIHLHQTDGDGEWLVELAPGGISIGEGHAKGDAAVRAPASDLLLLLWRRLDLSDVETFGDRALLGRFLAWTDLD